jgi:hypothetical protein
VIEALYTPRATPAVAAAAQGAPER